MKVIFAKENIKDLVLTFDLDQPISNKIKIYSESKEAQYSPLASKIFGFPWVEMVTIEPQKVSIKRADWVDWDMLAQPVADMIEQHFTFYDDISKIEENQEPPATSSESDDDQNLELPEEAKPIFDFIQTAINPQLAQHGGQVKMLDFQDGIVYLQMLGGCQGCGMAAQTMRDGIQVALTEEFDYVKAVKDITDHSEGLNPYYR